MNEGCAVLIDPMGGFDDLRARGVLVVEAQGVSSRNIRDTYLNLAGKLNESAKSSATFQRAETLKSQLGELRTLEQNWDSYGAPPPSAASIDNAELALSQSETLRVMPSAVVASAEGGAALCWDVGAKHAYFEFDNDGMAVCAMYDVVADPYIVEFEPTVQNVASALQQVRVFFR
ncbi:MAG: hypothetical protein ACXWNZ_18250 [Vulcanimicrobiaceae bacterium]